MSDKAFGHEIRADDKNILKSAKTKARPALAKNSTISDQKEEEKTGPAVSIRVMKPGEPPLTLPVDLSWTVEKLKSKVFADEENFTASTIIFLGRLLNNSEVLEEIGILKDTCVHALSKSIRNSADFLYYFYFGEF